MNEPKTPGMETVATHDQLREAAARINGETTADSLISIHEGDSAAEPEKTDDLLGIGVHV